MIDILTEIYGNRTRNVMSPLSTWLCLCGFAVALPVVTTLHAQCAPTAPRTPAPLGLLRLHESSKPGQAAALAVDRYAVDGLSSGAALGVSKSRMDGVDVLSLDANREWVRPLRGSGREVSFVSFQLYASVGTIVDIAGVRLGITISPVIGSVQLMVDESSAGVLQWKPLNTHIGAGKFDGRTLGTLPMLTIRLDPATNTWDLYVGSRLFVDHQPFIVAKKDDRRFVVRAGAEGAWLTGLVFCDENPLYEDANANGIDDAFERQSRGGLLAADTPVVVRSALAQQWKDAQRRKPPVALYVLRPQPDRGTAIVLPKK